MGRNAARRRAEKAEHGRLNRPAVRRGTTTKTMARLRERVAEVATKVQIEEMIAAAHPLSRPAVRDLLYRLADPGLPCCGLARLCAVQGQPVRHLPKCPAGGLVVLS